MSWLEKMGLVEREVEMVPAVETTAIQPEVEVDATIDNATNVVDEIYAQNDLCDKSDSIYAVQAFIDTLPSEMTTAKMQSTVAGILAVSKKSVADLLSDAESRTNVLCAARDKVVGERTNEISAANADIEELKKAIEMATIRIKEAEDIIEATKQSVGDELKIIDGLVEFCKGMEANQ